MEVEIFGHPTHSEPGAREVEVRPGARVRDLAQAIGVSLEAVELITIDGRVAGPGDRLAAGQRICFFPPIMGG